MKKLLILLMAVGLFTACNNDKTASRNDRDTRNSRDKDDYRSDDRDKDTRDDDRSTRDDSRDDDRTSTRDDEEKTSSRGWSSKDVNDFNTSCIESAVSGMDRATATRYCECMQVKLEKLYPNPNDAASIDMESNSMKQMVQDCLY